MNNLIYVFDKGVANELLDMQFVLLKADEENEIYVFANREQANFTACDFEYVLSDTLTF